MPGHFNFFSIFFEKFVVQYTEIAMPHPKCEGAALHI
jgi:hypothetical protein